MFLRTDGIRLATARCSVIALHAIVSLLMATLIGCGSAKVEGQMPVHPATGNVSFDGAPLEGATIIFTPTSPLSAPKGKRSPIPGARSDANGDFRVTTYATDDGIPVGQYKVSVSCEDINKPRLDMKGNPVRGEYMELLPAKYQDPSLSGIIVEITDGDNTLQDFALTR